MQEGSASRELLMNLNGQGWTLVELAEAARTAGIVGVIEILSTYCEEEGEYQYLLYQTPRLVIF